MVGLFEGNFHEQENRASLRPHQSLCLCTSGTGFLYRSICSRRYNFKNPFPCHDVEPHPTNLGLNRANNCQESYAKECTPSKESRLPQEKVPPTREFLWFKRTS